jgi:RNA polymerase sigma-70 factor, ECF subfamily
MDRSASDEQLAMKAQKGNHQAFLELYDRYLTKVYNRVKSRVPAADAEDVTQEVFIAVIRSLNGYEHRARFSTWLYTIVNRQIADYYRKHYRRNDNQNVTLDNEDQEIDVPAEEDENADDRVLIQRALTTLPESYQEIILLRFSEGLTFQEIADQRGQTLEAVKSLYRRAIQAVRNKIDDGQR